MSNLAVPVMRTWSVGEFETGAYFNSNVRDAGTFLLNVPICNAIQAAAQSLATSAWTSLNLDSTVVDSYGGHSNSTNNSRYTAQVAGWHLVSAAACIAATSTSGFRGVRVAKNGTPIVGSATDVSANSSNITAIASPAVIVFLAVGDYVEAQGFQSSGGPLNTSTNTDANCGITVVWLHA